jgi:mRNA interferase HigB
MRIITKQRILSYSKKHPNASSSLSAWLAVAECSKWDSLVNLRKTFPHADQVTTQSKRTVTIFNISGNHHRLITAIHYNTGIIYILNILTHAEYSKNRWLNDL